MRLCSGCLGPTRRPYSSADRAGYILSAPQHDAPENRFLLQPGGSVRGELQVPGDKSISHRALMLGALADGVTHISGLLAGADCLATAAALSDMGVTIERPACDRDPWRVHGVGMRGLAPAKKPLDLGNSGTSMRLFAGLLCPQEFASVLVGDSSLMRRPMERVAIPLRQMGAIVGTQDGKPPVTIQPCAGLSGIQYHTPVASAQIKSAILLAGLYASGETRVIEPGISRDHTERMLEAFGVKVDRAGQGVAVRQVRTMQAVEISVPGDLSSAAFFIVAACIGATGEVLLRNVGVNPSRTGVLNILGRMGARLDVLRKDGGSSTEPLADIRVRSSTLKGVEITGEDIALAIDEFPALMVAAAYAEGTTTVSGAGELRVKESDRISAVTEALKVLGIEVQERPDGLVVMGGRPGGGRIQSRGDHRIAMAFAVASLGASDPIEILDTANVATSYPNFVADARRLGIDIQEIRSS